MCTLRNCFSISFSIHSKRSLPLSLCTIISWLEKRMPAPLMVLIQIKAMYNITTLRTNGFTRIFIPYTNSNSDTWILTCYSKGSWQTKKTNIQKDKMIKRQKDKNTEIPKWEFNIVMAVSYSSCDVLTRFQTISFLDSVACHR